MANNINARPSRKSIRLTFRVSGNDVQLIREDRLPMMAPAAIGTPPEAGTHGGFWVEVRDANNRVLFHRALHFPLGDSVEVHSPDGTIKREFGPATESTFEVLVPDFDDASTVVLFGEYLDAESFRKEERPQVSRELARFDLTKKGGPNQEVEHGHE